MKPFTQEEQAAVKRAIAAAELRTSGEIVVVVASASDGYRSFALLWAALLALFVPLPLIFLTGLTVVQIYLVQLGAFALAAILLQWKPLRLIVVPGAVKRARAHQAAVRQFLVQNLHTTEDRTGVLIYVSLAERFAEVIADQGAYDKVSRETWTGVIDALTMHLKQGKAAEGFVTAVERCGNILAEHFPPGSENKNVLPNHLIVLP